MAFVITRRGTGSAGMVQSVSRTLTLVSGQSVAGRTYQPPTATSQSTNTSSSTVSPTGDGFANNGGGSAPSGGTQGGSVGSGGVRFGHFIAI